MSKKSELAPKVWGRKYVDGFTRKEFIRIYEEREVYDAKHKTNTLQSFIEYANENIALNEDGTHVISSCVD